MSTVEPKLLYGTLLTGVGIVSGLGAFGAIAAELGTIPSGLGINWLSEVGGSHLSASIFRQLPAKSPLEQAYRSAFTEALDTLQAQYTKTVDSRSDLRAFKLLRASFKEAAAYQYADDLDAPRTVHDRLATLLQQVLHGHDERQVSYLQTHLLLTVTNEFITTVMNDHAALTQYGTLLIHHLRTEMHQGQKSLTTQFLALTQSMDTVTMLLQQQFQALERAFADGGTQMETHARQHTPVNHLEGTNIAKDVVGTVIQTVKNITTTRPPPIAPVSRDTRTVAEAMLDDLPLDAIPEPVHQFAPESRWYGRERNPDFVGRESELRQLAASLKTGTTAVIGPTAVAHGMGGIGKTDLATEFAFRYGRFFAGGVFWLSFADPAQVDAEIAACGGADGLQLFLENDKLELTDQVKRVLQAWSQPIPRLIICDTCEDQQVLHRYRKQIGPQCRMLVTSRDQTWQYPSYTRIALDTLQRSESIHLLQRLCPRLNNVEADMVAEELGGFPLALHLAGSYLQTYDHHTIDDYLKNLRELDILNHPSMQGRGADVSPTEHDLHVARTFALSVDRLRPDDPIDALSRHLLACAAQLAPGEPIPRDFLLSMVPEGTDQDDAVDALHRVRTIGLMDGYDFIIIHRLVHLYIDELMHTHLRMTLEQVYGVVISLINKAEEIESTRFLLLLESHFQHIIKQSYKKETGQSMLMIDRVACFFQLQGRYAEAEPLYQHSLALRKQMLGCDHPSIVGCLSNLVELYYLQGRYTEAEILSIEGLCFSEQVFGMDHPDSIKMLHSLAGIYDIEGRYKEAESLLMRALNISESVLGIDHPETATSLSNLAFLYHRQGRYKKAEPLLMRALRISDDVLGTHHPKTTGILNNLAGLYIQQGRFIEAEWTFLKVLGILEQVLGINHPQTATSLSNLAFLYYQQERYDEALPLSDQACSVFLEVLGIHHPNTYVAQQLNLSLRSLVRNDENYGA